MARWPALKALGQPGEEGAPRAELRSKDAEPGAAAYLVDLVEQVDDVEPQLDTLQEAGGDRLDDAEIDLLIAGQGTAVRGPTRTGGSETAGGGEVGGKPSVRRRKRIFDPGR